ncbi:MAG: hypothetical protein SFY69_10565 [Planctomycetota bacterium]|nr:hypothetical protein [Planctomycetota bacterium]
MARQVAEIVVLVAAAYAGVGVVFALAFVVRGVQRVDAGAAGSGVLFRALIFPGVAALWPVMLRKWVWAPRGASGGGSHA